MAAACFPVLRPHLTSVHSSKYHRNTHLIKFRSTVTRRENVPLNVPVGEEEEEEPVHRLLACVSASALLCKSKHGANGLASQPRLKNHQGGGGDWLAEVSLCSLGERQLKGSSC